MKNVGTVVYVFDNGVSTMYTLPNAIINDDMQNKHYIVYTASKTSFDIIMHFGNPPIPYRAYYRDRDNEVKQMRQFMDLLNLNLWELFKSNDVASIYQLITGDFLELIELIHPDTYETKIKYHYFEANDGNVYDIKVMRTAKTFTVSVADITPDK